MFGRVGKLHRAKGDKHRDSHEWGEAATAYQQHLSENPADQPIYVQLGHALKEQGRLSEAMGAYATAVALSGNDADALRHLADALRRLGRREEALQAYHRANRLEPTEESASQIASLTSLSNDELGHPLEDGTILLSVQDLLSYLREHTTLTGIQRVQVGISLYAIRNLGSRAKFIVNSLEIESSALRPGQFWMIASEALLNIIRYATGPVVELGTLRAMIRACQASAIRVTPGPECTIVVLGAFWTLSNECIRYLDAKRAGVRVGVYLYDIIPITHPELCDDRLAVDFLFAFCEMANIADFFLTISDFTRQEVTRFISEFGGQIVPSACVRLAHHLSGGQEYLPPVKVDPLEFLNGRPYVAYVSTIEARKNHLYLVEAWRHLLAEGLPVPDLVFVGRKGWKIDPLFQLLEATDYLGGRVHLLHGLTDDEVDLVYSNCLFTVFTSLVEGWGLPAGESLYFGRPCVASRNSSIPEVGGDLLDYVDPLNLRDGIAVLRRMIQDSSYREGRAAQIAAEFVPRTWDVVSAEFFCKIDELRVHRVPLREPALREGTLCRLDFAGRRSIKPADYLAHPYRLSSGSSQLDTTTSEGMTWRGRASTLSIATGLGQGEEILLFLSLHVGPELAGARILLAEAGSKTPPTSIAVPTGSFHGEVRVRVPAIVQANGALRFRLTITSAELAEDFCGIALRSFGYARVGNMHARQEIVEQLVLTI